MRSVDGEVFAYEGIRGTYRWIPDVLIKFRELSKAEKAIPKIKDKIKIYTGKSLETLIENQASGGSTRDFDSFCEDIIGMYKDLGMNGYPAIFSTYINFVDWPKDEYIKIQMIKEGGVSVLPYSGARVEYENAEEAVRGLISYYESKKY